MHMDKSSKTSQDGGKKGEASSRERICDLSHAQRATTRLLIRALGEPDCGMLHALFQDPEVQRHFVIDGMTAESEVSWSLADSKSGRGGYFVIEMKDDPTTQVGVFLFWSVDPSEVGRSDDKKYVRFGFALFPAFRGRGMATEVSDEMIPFMQETLGIDHCVARCARDNVASQTVLRKSGFSEFSVCDGSGRLFFVKPAFQE